MKDLSVVLPVHNEEKNITRLYQEITLELSRIKFSYELVFVDDGSSDHSFELLNQISQKDPRVKIVKLLSNYGQSTALAAGIEHAEGENIVTMDSDLQHDPKDIYRLIEPLYRGYHVVCGWRKFRGNSDSFIKKTVPSRIANWMVNTITGLHLNDTTGGMRAFKKKVTELVPLYGEMHRYLPILAKWKGFRITERPIHVRKRGGGKTHYNFKRIFRGFYDLLTVKFFVSYSTRPSRIFAPIGIICALLGFIIGFYYLIQKLFFGVYLMQEIASLILSVMLILLGVNFICFGFIADMISFDSINQKKMYLIDQIIKH